MFTSSRSMRNSDRRAAQTGAACSAMDTGLLGGRALGVRLFVLYAADVIPGLLLSLLIIRSKLLPLRIS